VKDEATSWMQEETKVWVAGGRVAAGRSVGHGAYVCMWLIVFQLRRLLILNIS
jgi:hypothetical protein